MWIAWHCGVYRVPFLVAHTQPSTSVRTQHCSFSKLIDDLKTKGNEKGLYADQRFLKPRPTPLRRRTLPVCVAVVLLSDPAFLIALISASGEGRRPACGETQRRSIAAITGSTRSMRESALAISDLQGRESARADKERGQGAQREQYAFCLPPARCRRPQRGGRGAGGGGHECKAPVFVTARREGNN